MIRLIFVLRRKPSMSRDEFQKYWHELHGPLVAKHTTTLNILRYIQNHTLDDPMNEQMARARGGMEPPYDGVAELWFDSIDDLNKAFSEPRYLELIRPDELKFADLGNCVSFVTEEVPICG